MLRFLAALALIPAVAVAAVQTPFLRGEDVEERVRVPANSVCVPFILPSNLCSSAHAGIYLHVLVLSRR